MKLQVRTPNQALRLDQGCDVLRNCGANADCVFERASRDDVGKWKCVCQAGFLGDGYQCSTANDDLPELLPPCTLLLLIFALHFRSLILFILKFIFGLFRFSATASKAWTSCRSSWLRTV